MSSPLLTRIAAEHAAALSAQSPSPQLLAHRREALQSLLTQGLPTSRDENWRYANLRPLEKASFTPGVDAPPLDAMALPPAIEGFTRFVFIDGQFAPQLSAAPGAVGAAQLTRLQGELPSHGQAFALLNEAFATDGADIHVSASGAPVDIEVVFYSASAAAAYPRLNVRLAPNARLRLIERYVGSVSAAQFIDPVVRIEVAAGAAFNHYRLQETGAAATWTDTLRASVARDGRYDLHLLQVGALAARSTVDIQLTGSGAQTRIDTVSLADAQQVHDHMIVVDHQAAHTQTVENFRGIAGGRARIGFNGLIIVRDSAQHADSAQSLKGLITGSDAEIDLRPQLEIHTDEVRCSHGATTGKLDDAMLFYLLTRGIDPAVAQRLLKWAFITDVVAKIDVPALRVHVQRSLASHMQDAQSLEECCHESHPLRVAAAGYDVERVRRDFPILSRTVHGKPLVFLDSAASSQRPLAVIRAVEDYETRSHANVHRGVHALSQEATAAFEGARERVRRFINARSTREIIFHARHH